MVVLIDDMIYTIKNAQFLDDRMCLYPVDQPYVFEISYDSEHSKRWMIDSLLKEQYMKIDWLEDVQKEYF